MSYALHAVGPTSSSMTSRKAGPPAPTGDWWHYSLGWRDTSIEESCPCPKAACGYIELGTEEPSCPHHGTWARAQWHYTPRSGHPSRICVHYVRPMTAAQRHAARRLGHQLQRLRMRGMQQRLFEALEHPSLLDDGTLEPDDDAVDDGGERHEAD